MDQAGAIVALGDSLTAGYGVGIWHLLNDRPDAIATTFFSDTAYDSTNYSALGRVVSATVTKRF